MLGSMDIPNSYMVSEEARTKLSEYSNPSKQALSLARFYQNPIAEVLNLWNDKPEDNLILNLNLHRLQK